MLQPVDDDRSAVYYRLEVQRGEAWGPAVAGALNCSEDDDATASTFPALHDAHVLARLRDMPTRPQAVRLVDASGHVLFTAHFGGA